MTDFLKYIKLSWSKKQQPKSFNKPKHCQKRPKSKTTQKIKQTKTEMNEITLPCVLAGWVEDCFLPFSPNLILLGPSPMGREMVLIVCCFRTLPPSGILQINNKKLSLNMIRHIFNAQMFTDKQLQTEPHKNHPEHLHFHCNHIINFLIQNDKPTVW